MKTYILFVYGIFDDYEDMEFFCAEILGQSPVIKSVKYVVENSKNIIVIFDSDLDHGKLSEEIYVLCLNDSVKFYFLLERSSIVSVNLPDPINNFVFKDDTPESAMLKIEYKKKKLIEFDLDEVLDKLNQMGFESLTPEEKNFLDNFDK